MSVCQTRLPLTTRSRKRRGQSTGSGGQRKRRGQSTGSGGQPKLRGQSTILLSQLTPSRPRPLAYAKPRPSATKLHWRRGVSRRLVVVVVSVAQTAPSGRTPSPCLATASALPPATGRKKRRRHAASASGAGMSQRNARQRRIDRVPALGNLSGRRDATLFRNFLSRPMKAPEKSFSVDRIACEAR